jgi:hypothetical protein
MLNLPIFKNNKSSLIFVLTLLIVGILIFIFLKFYNTYQVPAIVVSDEASLPITIPLLHNISTWKNYNLIFFRLIRESSIDPNSYTLLIKFDWNNLSKSISSFQHQFADNRLAIKNQQTQAFNSIVDSLDTSTLNGVINNWTNSAIFRNIALYNDFLVGISPSATNIDNPISNLSQTNVNAIFNFIDSVNHTVIDLKNIIYLSLKNRLLFIKLPLSLSFSTPNSTDSVTLQYRPDFSILNKINNISNTSIYNLDFNVFDSKIIITSPSKTNSDITISFI